MSLMNPIVGCKLIMNEQTILNEITEGIEHKNEIVTLEQ